MSRSGQSRLYLLPVVAVITFAVSLSWGVQRLNIQQELLHSSESTGGWIATQAEIERLKFVEALHRYVNGAEGASHEELMLRFEIFWSRVGVILNGEEGKVLRQIDGVGEHAGELLRILQQHENAVENLKHGDLATYHVILSDLSPFAERLHAVTQESLLNIRPRYIPCLSG